MIDKVVCPICGRTFKSLMSHIINIHEMNIEKLLDRFPETVLVSNSTKQKASTSCIESGCGLWIKGRKISEEEREARSIRQTGENNNFYGKTHTDETKQLMSENHADFTKDKNPYRNWLKEHPEDRIKASDRSKKAFADIKDDPIRYASRIEKLSKSMAQAHIDGKLLGYGRGHKSGYFTSNRFQCEFYYRSSYEMEFLHLCENDISIYSLKACDFTVPYLHPDGYHKNYIPDFLINENILVEIKPLTMISSDMNEAKLKSAKNFCVEKSWLLCVLTEPEIKELKSNVYKAADFLENHQFRLDTE